MPRPVNQVVITLNDDGSIHVMGRLPKVRAAFLMMMEDAKEHCLQEYYRPKPGEQKGTIVVAPADFLHNGSVG